MALTTIPSELSSVSGISDSSTSTAITINSSQEVTFAADVTFSGNITTGSNTISGVLSSVTGSIGSAATATTQAASDNSTKLATTAYVTTALANLVDSAPGTLNTLNELAAALGDDANFSTTVTNSIAAKLPLAGGTLTGDLDIKGGATALSVYRTLAIASDTQSEITLGSQDLSSNYVDAVKIRGLLKANKTDGELSFYTLSSSSLTEQMRIDSSGNVLVGATTTTNLSDGSGNDGVHLNPSGTVAAARTSNVTAVFNRLSSNGEIVRFNKDGSTVGSISTLNGMLAIGNGNLFLNFDGATSNDYIYPMSTAAGGASDGVVTLGFTSRRFKDLHLSNAANIGKEVSFTNSANSSGFDIGLLGGSSDATAFIYQRANDSLKFGTNNTERMSINQNGSVGIGVTPRTDTHSSWGQLFIGEKGSLISEIPGNSGYYGTLLSDNLYIDTDTGAFANITTDESSLYSQEAGVHRWYSQGSGTAGAAVTLSQKMLIDSSGYVGIGNAVPSSYYSKNLVVTADGDGTGGITIVAPATNDTTYLAFADGTSGSAAYRGYVAYSHNTDSLFFGSGGGTKATLDSSGKFNISSERLEISNSGDTKATFIRASNQISYAMSTASSGGHGFYDNQSSAYDIYMKAGKVGIGTTTPGAPLHISNNAAAADDTTLLVLENGNSTGDIATPDTFIDFKFSDGNTNVTPQARIAAHAGDGGDANTQVLEGRGYLTFHTSNTTATSGTVNPPERMRIDATGITTVYQTIISAPTATGGFFQAGTTDPVSMQKSGSHGYFNNTAGGNFYMRMGSSYNTTFTYTSGGNLFFNSGDRINYYGSNFYVLNDSNVGVRLIDGNTSWTTQSDERTKENITDIGSVLSKIKDYRCVEYNLKSQDRKMYGLIAQDWETDFPHLVDEDDNFTVQSDGTTKPADEEGNTSTDAVKTLSYNETIPVLLKAIQEQQALIEALQTKVAALEGE